MHFQCLLACFRMSAQPKRVKNVAERDIAGAVINFCDRAKFQRALHQLLPETGRTFGVGAEHNKGWDGWRPVAKVAKIEMTDGRRGYPGLIEMKQQGWFSIDIHDHLD